MARKKVTLAYIPNDATRRATIKKRRRGLLKKASELSVLCGVDVCAVVYAGEEPEVFPSPEKGKEILMRMCQMPDLAKKKKMVDQRNFLEQRHHKLNQQVRRLEHENAELAAKVLFRKCLDGLSAESLGKEEADALLELIERKAKSVQFRMHQLGAANCSPLLLLPAPPLPIDIPLPVMASPISSVDDSMEKLDFETVAMQAMWGCNWIDESVGGPPLLPDGDGEVLQYGHGTMIGCSSDGRAPDDLDLPAILMGQMNNKFAFDGVFLPF